MSGPDNTWDFYGDAMANGVNALHARREQAAGDANMQKWVDAIEQWKAALSEARGQLAEMTADRDAGDAALSGWVAAWEQKIRPAIDAAFRDNPELHREILASARKIWEETANRTRMARGLDAKKYRLIFFDDE